MPRRTQNQSINDTSKWSCTFGQQVVVNLNGVSKKNEIEL